MVGWVYIHIYIYTHNPIIINRGSPRCSRVVSKYGHERGTTTRESSLLACVLHDMGIYPTSICKILGWHKHNHHNLPVQPKNNHFLVHFFLCVTSFALPPPPLPHPHRFEFHHKGTSGVAVWTNPTKKTNSSPPPKKNNGAIPITYTNSALPIKLVIHNPAITHL